MSEVWDLCLAKPEGGVGRDGAGGGVDGNAKLKSAWGSVFSHVIVKFRASAFTVAVSELGSAYVSEVFSIFSYWHVNS